MRSTATRTGLLAGAAALLIAIPALSQERRSPESLLPPGFGDPQNLPPPGKATPTPRPPSHRRSTARRSGSPAARSWPGVCCGSGRPICRWYVCLPAPSRSVGLVSCLPGSLVLAYAAQAAACRRRPATSVQQSSNEARRLRSCATTTRRVTCGWRLDSPTARHQMNKLPFLALLSCYFVTLQCFLPLFYQTFPVFFFCLCFVGS